MHAVFNPSFNALATAMATARHRASQVLEIARDRHVEQALNETPDKLTLILLRCHVYTIVYGQHRSVTLHGFENYKKLNLIHKALSAK
ncbi:unnamed protein product [Ranitomeya imitator]|uniref:Uncharacterized protein n=1 Tax=Ranitomeya imitator TaxID=111125 RepID=A0ABN9LS62_9NEOB|nr:unnamed protein product [Ranitomeya imitator]